MFIKMSLEREMIGLMKKELSTLEKARSSGKDSYAEAQAFLASYSFVKNKGILNEEQIKGINHKYQEIIGHYVSKENAA